MIPYLKNPMGMKSRAFITRWSVSDSETIYLPLVSGGTYNMYVDWGDGSNSTITDYSSNTHTYTNAGTYDIKITGTCSLWNFNSVQTSKGKITAVLNWGDVGITSMNNAFNGCTNLASLAPYAPNVASYASAFYNCPALTTIPAKLFANCINTTSFNAVFMYSYSISGIPAGLFSNCASVTTYTYAFCYCTGLSGAAPELWNLDPEPTGTSCFYNCTNLTNYADIPTDWK